MIKINDRFFEQSKTKKAVIGIIAVTLVSIAASQAVAGNTVYKYDALGRVIEVDYPDGSVIKYTYDAAGNRTQVVKTAGS